jgi:hypothetical protein
MNTKIKSNRLPGVAGIALVVVLIAYLVWSGANGWGGADIIASIGLALAIGALVYLKQLENISEKTIAQRIRAEYPSASQPQVFEIYKHLKIKELEGLFLKILDDAHGDLHQVKKLASVAESVGWRAFLENDW